jgi:ribonuclease D
LLKSFAHPHGFFMTKGATLPELPEQIVQQPDELVACCEHLAAARDFGFDTEFVGEDSYHPHLCLLQVATAERLYLIDPLTAGPLDRFWQIVVDPANRVVVHAGREEVRLCHLQTGRTPSGLFDLQIVAGMIGLVYPIGHGTLVNQLLDIQISKGETLTEWRHRPLTQQQIRYAFDDVRYLLPLSRRLTEELQRLNRLDWATEEFGRLAATATAEEAAQEKWRKLRGLGTLDRGRLAVVRELFRWREEIAARMNRPPRTLVRDDLLIEIARRNPKKEHDLRVIRGLAHRHLPAILEVVQRARALPSAEYPSATERDFDPPQFGLVTNLLSAVLGDFCARRRLATNLVASGNDLKLLVRSHRQGQPLPSECLLGQGWRATHVLPELRAILEGQRAVRVADVAREAPFVFEEVSRERQRPGQA